MNKQKVKFEDMSTYVECSKCRGASEHLEACNCCKGTGKYKRDRYLLIAKQSNGQNIAFDVDNPGK